MGLMMMMFYDDLKYYINTLLIQVYCKVSQDQLQKYRYSGWGRRCSRTRMLQQ